MKNETDKFDDSPKMKTKAKLAAGSQNNVDDDDVQFVSNRNLDEEEQVWQNMIEKHGRNEYNTVYDVMAKFVSDFYSSLTAFDVYYVSFVCRVKRDFYLKTKRKSVKKYQLPSRKKVLLTT